jgi:hypothetical protein
MTPHDTDDRRRGQPIAVDPSAASADASLPAFIARPDDAPVYHGFQVFDGVEVDGFRLGTISAPGPDDYGDAFIIAPDNSRAGLVWEVGDGHEALEVCPFEPTRWGVWAVEVPQPMASAEAARLNLEALVPRLRSKWEAWRADAGR